jgi:hypothetical protein
MNERISPFDLIILTCNSLYTSNIAPDILQFKKLVEFFKPRFLKKAWTITHEKVIFCWTWIFS